MNWRCQEGADLRIKKKGNGAFIKSLVCGLGYFTFKNTSESCENNNGKHFNCQSCYYEIHTVKNTPNCICMFGKPDHPLRDFRPQIRQGNMAIFYHLRVILAKAKTHSAIRWKLS